MRRPALVLATAALIACGGNDTAAGWPTTTEECMTTFDPEAAGASADFVDGTTTVNANFLDALDIRFSSARDAAVALADIDGAVATLADQHLSTRPLEILDEVAAADPIGLVQDGAWDINAEWIFYAVSGATLTRRSLEAITGSTTMFGLETPAWTYTPSWNALSSPTVDWIYASDKYLVVIGVGGGTYYLDVVDLTTDTLVGTYTVVGGPHGTIDGNNRGRHVMGRAHFYLQTDTSTASLYAITLSTATLDTSWATSGVFTLNYGESDLALDDRYVVAIATGADDVEVIDVNDGSQITTNPGIGTGTDSFGICSDGKGHFFVVQAAGGDHIGKYMIDDEQDFVQVAEQAMAFDVAAGIPVCDGRWVYIPQASAPVLVAYRADTLARWMEGPLTPAATNFLGNGIKHDGLHIIGATLAADTWDNDGFVRLKGIEQVRRVQRVAHGGYCRGPFKSGLAPIDF